MLWILPIVFRLLAVPAGAAQLTLILENVEQPKGNFFAAFYNREKGFLEEGQHFRVETLRQQGGGEQQFLIANLPVGEVAIAVFQDSNGNGRLDKTFAGIPTEPYGFSRGARPRFRAPRWAESFFSLKFGENTCKIRVEKW